MLSFTYVSSRGNEYDLLTNEKMITECNAFDYEFSPITFGKRYGSKIYGFEMEHKTIDVTIYFFGENRKSVINAFIADLDYDVMNEKIGKLVCNDYSIPAYGIASKDGTLNSSNALWDSIERTFIAPYPFWRKRTFAQLFEQNEEQTFTDIKDYLPTSTGGVSDYPFDLIYTSFENASFENSGERDYILTINGQIDNPNIVIGDLEISLNLTIHENEYLTINGLDKTVILTRANGEKVNCYGSRDVSVDIFKKIPSGIIPVYWNGDYSFYLELYDERTAPLWN